jgi:hypothetical protein
MQAELTKMVGSKVYDRFVALVQEREGLRAKGVALPHPAVRSRQNGAATTSPGAPEGAAAAGGGS